MLGLIFATLGLSRQFMISRTIIWEDIVKGILSIRRGAAVI
jgi:hypothetical protein